MSWITLTLFYFLIFLNLVARKRLVAPVPWGGEEEAQEEASCSESQLLLHGCKMSRYAFCTHTHTGHLGFEFYLWAFAGVWVLDYRPLWLFCRMLQDHDGVQPCSDSRAVCGLLYSPVSAHRRQSTSHRGSVFIYSRGVLRWHSVACWYKHRLYHAFFFNLFWGVCGRGRNI